MDVDIDKEVEVRIVNNRKGKGLFAKKNFKIGDVIFQEDPLVCCQFAWNANDGYQACDHCMKPLESAEENIRRLTKNLNIVLSYPQCCETDKNSIVECNACGVKYCSEQCKNLSFQQYHRTLCIHTKERLLEHPLEKLTESWMALHFPPESCNIMLVARIIATKQQSPNLEQTIQQLKQFSDRTLNEDVDLAHKLVGETNVCCISELLDYLSQALPLNGCENWLTLEDLQSFLALIETNGQRVCTSPFSVWVKNATHLPLPDNKKAELDKFIDKLYNDSEEESGSYLNNEGSALYSLQSSCNHSCVPNAEPNFLNNNYRLSMVALKDIPADEEIVISYLEECVLQCSRLVRQKVLAEKYLFKCECQKCANPDMSTSEDE